MSRQQDVDLAQHAKTMLTNPAYIDAYARYEAKIIERMRLLDPKDTEMLQTLQRHLVSLSVVRKNMEIMVGDGAEAKEKIDFEARTLAQRAKSALRRIA